MREIKFEAYDLETKKIYRVGDIVIYKERDKNGMLGEVFYEENYSEGKRGSRYFGDGELEQCKLMQSTGLLDKEGKEIFEGDIILVNHNGTPVKNIVIYYRGGFQIKKGYLGQIVKERIKIIGNIYQNKNLLENN